MKGEGVTPWCEKEEEEYRKINTYNIIFLIESVNSDLSMTKSHSEWWACAALMVTSLRQCKLSNSHLLRYLSLLSILWHTHTNSHAL